MSESPATSEAMPGSGSGTGLPLAGIRVLELGQLIAGPFAGQFLAGFGAEVIKVEPPGGDPLRRWRKLHDGTSLWWYSLARNKKSVTLDLRQDAGRAVLKRMIENGVDVVLENFRPGRMEAWGLGYPQLRAIDKRIVMVRVSGYGQTGPYANKPGFANVAEAFGGLRHLTGEQGRPPVRSGISLGDSLAGLHAAIGTLMAIYERDTRSGEGQMVDCALYESVFNVLESLLPEYDFLGHVREPRGARLEGVVPTNSYPCEGGKFVVIGANGDAIFRRLMLAIGRADLANDPRLRHNDGRAQFEDELDDAIAAFTSRLAAEHVLDLMDRAEVPAGPILSIADIAADPHYLARGMFERVSLPDNTSLAVPKLVPVLGRTPARTRHAGPRLGEHNEEIYRDWLGLDEGAMLKLKEDGVV